MKWNNELDNKLKSLINLNKDYNEIAKEFNVSYRTLTNRAFRLGLKVLKQHHEIILCKNCGKSINKTLSNEKKFCNQSCSAQYNNKRRKHSEETKNKIRHTIKSKFPTKMKENKIVRNKKLRENRPLISIRKCRFCGNDKPILKHKIICSDCGFMYYKFYRPLCEFNINVNDYPDEFNLSLVKKLGWYSPSNKGNNLNGVSKDHIYSVYDGFKNNVDFNILKHPANCKLVQHIDNNKKKCQSLITLDKLLLKIKKWNEKYVSVVQ
jgi:ribosomal protein L37E